MAVLSVNETLCIRQESELTVVFLVLVANESE